MARQLTLATLLVPALLACSPRANTGTSPPPFRHPRTNDASQPVTTPSSSSQVDAGVSTAELPATAVDLSCAFVADQRGKRAEGNDHEKRLKFESEFKTLCLDVPHLLNQKFLRCVLDAPSFDADFACLELLGQGPDVPAPPLSGKSSCEDVAARARYFVAKTAAHSEEQQQAYDGELRRCRSVPYFASERRCAVAAATEREMSGCLPGVLKAASRADECLSFKSDAIDVTGKLSARQVQEGARVPGVCHSFDPTAHGTVVTVRFVIDRRGVVVGTPTITGIAVSKTVQCVAGDVAGLTFPSSEGDTRVTLQYRIQIAEKCRE